MLIKVVFILLFAWIELFDNKCDGQPALDEKNNYPLTCMLRQYNFTAKTVDDQGNKCKGRVSTKACFGSCESFEYGTHEFPFIVSANPACNYDQLREISLQLTDCDQGASLAAQQYKYYEAVSCVCKELHPTEEGHKTLPTKRNGFTTNDLYYIYPEDDSFDNYLE